MGITHWSQFASDGDKMARFHLLFSSLLLCIAGGCSGTLAAEGDLRVIPCPHPQDIFPCVCSVHEANVMDMDCSEVENEDQLARVFSATFPFTKFRKLTIDKNSNVKVLRDGDLGVASFTEIIIANGKLEEVQAKALSQSYSTVTSLSLYNNEISTFPFEDLQRFTSLGRLNLYDNKLTKIPTLMSDSITYLSLGNNLINEIPVLGLPYLQEFYGNRNDVEQIMTGTFSGLPDLYYVSVTYNSLSHIQEGTIQIINRESRETEVYLYANNISKIEVGAITGLNGGKLYLHFNALTVLDEDVFRPFLEAGVKIWLYENPLTCGCDIAWLVTNADFMALLDGKETCYNGQLVSDLDPGIYEDIC